ncbi:MAG: S41 family peptidase [Candidatus Krumholzibacteria bacterium]|nr:S41 family peptidase [Candidatus Krumholzibacteria bacterium]
MNRASLEMVWSTVNERFWDPEFRGVEWAAVREKHMAWLDRASTMEEARGVMSAMIDLLGVSHMTIIPSAFLNGGLNDGAPGLVETAPPEGTNPAGEHGSAFVLGHLPPVAVTFESRGIDDDIGYIRFDCFMDPVFLMTRFNGAMESFLEREGVVIDLRGNMGGVGAMVMGMAGWFAVEKGASMGTIVTREARLDLILNPRPSAFGGRLAVLVDSLTVSSAEMMAAGLQETGRARIFGGRTMGMALQSEVILLPNGDGFQCVTGNYISPLGRSIEGRGVIPDVEIASADGAGAGSDEALEAAVAWIRDGDNDNR